MLRSVCAETPWRWSSILPIVEFAMKKFRLCLDRIYSVLRERPHPPPRSVKLPLCGSGLDGGEVADQLIDVSPATVQKPVSVFLTTRLNVLRHVHDAMADRQTKQKE